MIYRTRARQLSYGRPVGILTLEESIPCPPGTPGNPTTFPFPVCYEIVRGADIESLRALNRPDSFPAFLAAGRRLVERGACAVAGNCGLMAVHQDALSAALPVPVLMSSLLQLPLIARLFGPEAQVGVIASSLRSLKPEHLRMACGPAPVRTVLAAMDGRPCFAAAMAGGELDFQAVEAEAVAVARALAADTPGLCAILLECVDLPPYAAAIQEATDLPVFDVTTLIGHAASALSRRPFSGVY